MRDSLSFFGRPVSDRSLYSHIADELKRQTIAIPLTIGFRAALFLADSVANHSLWNSADENSYAAAMLLTFGAIGIASGFNQWQQPKQPDSTWTSHRPGCF